MATAISPDNFKAALGAAFDAIEADNWALAWKEYAKAAAQHAGLKASGSVDGGSFSRQQSLDGLKSALEAAQAAQSSSTPFEVRSRFF